MITFKSLIPFMILWAAFTYYIGSHFSSEKSLATEPSTLHNFLQSPIVFGICLVGYFALVFFVKTKQYKAGEAL